MQIDVLMSVYKNDNIEHFKQAVESIIKQTLLPEKIIIVRDGIVSDDIEFFLNELEKNSLFKILRIQENVGLSSALNRGLELCTARFIARMDADDVAHIDRFEKQLKYLQENDLDVCACLQEEFIDDYQKPISYKSTPKEHIDIKKALYLRCVISHPGIFLKRTSLVNAGGYDTTTGLMEDYDLHMKLINSGNKYGCLQEYLISVRVSMEQRIRRSGLIYILNGIKLKYRWYRLNFLPLKYFIFSSVLFSIFVISPSYMKHYLYKLLRKKIR